MSKADWVYLRTTQKILKDGSWDTDMNVRPVWEDGTPAHTKKAFAVNNVYNLAQEFPIVSMRFINWKAAIDEILWIWKDKDNNINNLHSHVWDEWADENGSIGKAYGWQLGQKAQYREGKFDQVDRVLWTLKNNPADRSNLTEIFVHKDLHEMGLNPCVHEAQFDVANGKLNMFLKQRSNDTLAAGSWNVVQYSALLKMFAQVSGLQPGVLSHMIVNSHIYDRHIPFVVDLTLSRVADVEKRALQWKRPSATPEQTVFLNMLFEYNQSQRARRLLGDMDDLKDLCKVKVNYRPLIDQARKLEEQSLSVQEYMKYLDDVTKTKEFEKASRIVDIMANNPDLDAFLGYRMPMLNLDKNVSNFYDFVSPKTKDENGNFVDNPNSSFQLQNYDYKTEGIKFQTKVPIAK